MCASTRPGIPVLIGDDGHHGTVVIGANVFPQVCGMGATWDPYASLTTVPPLLVHLHAKDVSIRQAGDERGKVTGTPVGCACGEAVIDWPRVVGILGTAGWSGVLSVECGTPQQAEDSLFHLGGCLAGQPATAV